ncbi:MAG: repeat containing protein, partial [Gammaproteobacteria bacterium]|nr:repeat containing protein [Gammaproteobacteria bacterium]
MPGENTAAAIKSKEQGNKHFKLGKFDLALNCYNLGIMLDPAVPELWYNKGMAHKKINEPFLAAKAFDKALDLRPDYEKARSEKASLTFKKVVAFLVADLTLNEAGEVKILEFGRGLLSGLTGHDSLVGSKYDHIQNKLKRLLRARYNKAPVFFNSGFGIPVADDSKLDKWLVAVQKAMPDAPIKGIYGGITVRKVPQDILVLDHDPRLGLLGGDKQFCHLQFNPDIIKFRPKTSIVSVPYHPKLIEEVDPAIRDAEHSVVKCPDGANGMSVEIVSKGRLATVLKQLLSDLSYEDIKKAGYEAAQEIIKRGGGWAELKLFEDKFALMHSSSSGVVLVEQFSPSKIIKVEGESFHPTMRAVFAVEIEGESSEFMPIAAYWKLPKKPEGKGCLEDAYISKVDPGRISSTLVSKQDEDLVFAQLKDCMPTVIKNALGFDIHRYALGLIEAKGAPEAEKVRKHGIYLMRHYANNLSGLGEKERALEVIEITGAYEKDHQYYREKGVAYQAAGEYDSALREYEKARRLAPDDPAINRRIAVVQRLMAGDIDGAIIAKAQTVFSPE